MEFWVIVIGGAVIVGVLSYTWASSRHAAQRRRTMDRGGNIDSREFIGQILQEDVAKSKNRSNKKQGNSGRQEPMIGEGAKRPASGQAAKGAITPGPRQASLIDNNVEKTPPEQPGSQAAESAPSFDHQPELILLYVMARNGAEFRCSGVNRMLTRAGCLLDDRGVFNLKDEDQRASFSIVNALEPATFDHERMDVSNTRGLAFFFETRGAGDRRRFETMMNTARRLSVELDGELLDEKREPYSSVREQRYRSDLAD